MTSRRSLSLWGRSTVGDSKMERRRSMWRWVKSSVDGTLESWAMICASRAIELALWMRSSIKVMSFWILFLVAESRINRCDRRWGVGERRRGDRDGRPASLLVMLAPKGQQEGAGLFLDLRWGEGEGEEPRRRGSRERDLQGWRVRGERWRPSDELVSRETSRLSHRDRLAGGDRRLVGEESGDTWGRLTLAWFLSVDDLSLDLLRRRMLLPARFDPALRWARDASRSSEGLSCRSESGPMIAGGTAGPTVCWGGVSPTNCCQ